MSTTYLTAAELEELTELKVGFYQARWLKMNGYPYELSRYGKPKVLRAYAEQRGGLANSTQAVQTEPDFSHWKQPRAA